MRGAILGLILMGRATLTEEIDTHPNALIFEPYEMTIKTMGVAERRNWSRRVPRQH